MKNKEKDLQKALKTNAKKLTVAGLQDAILTLYKENEGKKFSARHIIEKLEVGNNKDSVHYAVEQLVGNGKLAMDTVDNILSANRGRDKSDRQGRKNKAKEIGDNLENVEKLAETAEEFADRVRKEKANFRQKREEKARKSDNRTQLDRPDNRQPDRQNDPSKRSAPRELKFDRGGNSGGDERRKVRGGLFEGIVDVTKTGAGYVICEGQEQDIYVPQKFLNGAMKGDRVKVSAYFPAGKRRPDGEVIKILQRSTDAFLGTFHFSKNNGYVQTDRIDVPEIYVKLEDAKGAEDGMKVVVQILDWNTERGKRMTGKITTVLGMAGSSDIEMKGILINNGFNIEFSDEVLAEAAKIHDDTEGDAKNRRDFRGITTFTIDPFDAKDFDDALSFEVLKNGNIEIGVHIADVTHYIKPNTALDKEAYLRSTSVYLVDRVCPMLPERLSNELCSLRPNEDKLTFSAVFEFDDTYKVVNKWFGKTLIHSNRRYAYEEAQAILQSGEGDYADELLKLNQIAYALRKKRYKDGAINFETDEVKFKLDEAGVPIEVYIKERNDSHLLIEDFMLLANRSVAEFMAKRDDAPRKKGVEVPYIYRTHDGPNQDKLNDLAAFALELGVKLKLDTPKNISKSLNDLAEKSEKDETLRLLTPIAIRCMAKADYSSENIGHYGLAFEFYSHFTSPIRRYSDVLAHRILFENLKDIKRYDKAELDEQCKHISKQEKKAADSERQSIKYKQVEYMTKHIGEVFEGTVSGMIERGLFVEIKHMMAEGMVDFARCPEPFEVEPSRLRARGLRTGKVLKMGQMVKVEIVDADMETRKIDMRLLEY
jgi:ribonuclease R